MDSIEFELTKEKHQDVQVRRRGHSLADAIESPVQIFRRNSRLLDTIRREKSVTRKSPSALAEAGAVPNPQGKGQVGFLLDWAYSSPRAVVAKRAPQLLADYFTSLLVLSAAFKFKPVFGKDYYLYVDGDGWSLSLISPDEWNDDARRRAWVGKCVLHADSTWSITPSGNIGRQGRVAEALSKFYDGFIDKLRSQRVLEDGLPFYEAGLPYYQRLFASALSRSLKGSLALADQLGICAETWLARMPRHADRLFLDRKTGP
jgi:hypothetical protein